MNKTTLAPQAKTAGLMPSSQRTLQRKCACGNHAMAGGQCEECAKKKSILQRKLAIGASNDPLEQEADRVADQVMSMPLSSKVNVIPPRIQRFSGQASEGLETAPPSVDRVLSSSGKPLEPALRHDMEARFGHDFSQVRVYTGSDAEQSAREVNAHAYTMGNNVVFGAGRYAPETFYGRRLLAHELTHIVQQHSTNEPYIQRTLAGCQDLLTNPSVVSLISGSLVHRIIGTHFRQTVSGARNVFIPGASAGPLRSQAICGGDNPVIDPQIIGGISGAGIPDLARVTPGGILQVAEIKPAAIPCLIDGEEQLLRYIDQGNAQDVSQISWRASLGVTVVSPILESAYTPPNFQISVPGIARAELRTAWCTPGLLAYTVNVSGQPIVVPVPQTRRNEERQRLRNEANTRAIPVAVGIGATAVVAVAGRALWRHFWRAVIQRFAIRGAIALGLSAADGPLLFGELVSLGLAVVTIIQIIQDWNDLWREADRISASES